MHDHVQPYLEDPAVDVVEVFDVLPDDEFAETKARGQQIDGGVGVVVVNDDGAVLLVENDWSDGYLPPGGGVEPGEHPEEAAVREVREETGVEVELERAIRVETGWIERESDGERFGPGYGVTYLARPVGDETVADDPGVADEEILDVAWFDEVPERTPTPELLDRFVG